VNPENLYPLGEIDYYPSLVSALSREFYAQAGTTDPFYSGTGDTFS